MVFISDTYDIDCNLFFPNGVVQYSSVIDNDVQIFKYLNRLLERGWKIYVIYFLILFRKLLLIWYFHVQIRNDLTFLNYTKIYYRCLYFTKPCQWFIFQMHTCFSECHQIRHAMSVMRTCCNVYLCTLQQHLSVVI